MANKKEVPIWKKACMTIEETAAYSNIGQDRIRELTKNTNCAFTLRVGTKTLIKRKQFDDYLRDTNVI